VSFLGLPTASAWLLLAAAAAAVVGLYLLKPTARRLTVASGLIWRRVLEQRRRRPQRWRWWLSLLLALVIALSIAAALTRPQLAAIGGVAADVVLVIDTSASMGTRAADGATRLSRALERAEAIVAAGGAGSRFLVADTTHQIATPVFASRDEALARLRALRPRPGVPAWFPDVAALRADAHDRGAHDTRQLWFITDGVAPLPAPRGVDTVSVFEPADNVGLIAFDVRAAPAEPRRFEAYVEVGNASPGAKRVALQVAGVGAEPLQRALRIAPGDSARLILDLSSFREGPVQARVAAAGDGFEPDDTALAFLPAKSRARVALVSAGNPALLRSLRLLPRVDVELLAPGTLRGPSRFDVLVLDRLAPARAPALPALLIAPGAASWLPATGGEVRDTRIERWNADHPLLTAVPLRDVLIERAMRIGAAAETHGALGFETLASGSHGEPLILATREGRRFALLDFALEDSNFARQPGFPALLSNAVDWLTREPQALAYPLGQVRLPVADAHVLDLAGAEVKTRAVPGATLFEADAPGLYTAVAREQRLRIAVNALDPVLTGVNATRLARAAETAAPAVSPPRVRADPWLLLLALAAALLALEWLMYNRRLTV
jgi:hypothetical protein